MRTIYKYKLDIVHEQRIKVPFFAKPLCVQAQDGELCIWFEVVEGESIQELPVYINGTGLALRGNTYVGTAQLGQFVWHVYV